MIIDFPGGSPTLTLDYKSLRELRPDLTDEQINRAWAEFAEMRYRVSQPLRRNGAPCVRIEGSATLVPEPHTLLGRNDD